MFFDSCFFNRLIGGLFCFPDDSLISGFLSGLYFAPVAQVSEYFLSKTHGPKISSKLKGSTLISDCNSYC